jgi:alpha-beta hydrolase superfamily lysophospholipase
MTPIMFGDARLPLQGLYHAPTAGDGARRDGVVLCNPFGHEAIRAHRLYRALALALARAGRHVLRFDYSGTGDSGGDEEDGALARWRDDVKHACEELMATAGLSRVSLFGVGLGGSVAALAADGSIPVDVLALWDPVIEGGAYLDRLAVAHAAFLRDEFELPVGGRACERWRVRGDDVCEALGHVVTARLRAELQALDLHVMARGRTIRARRVALFESRGAAGVERLGRCLAEGELRIPVAREALPVASPWASDEAMNAASVPMAVIDAVVGRLGAGA